MTDKVSHMLFRGVKDLRAERKAENDKRYDAEAGWERVQRFGVHDQDKMRMRSRDLRESGYETRTTRDPSGDYWLERRKRSNSGG